MDQEDMLRNFLGIPIVLVAVFAYLLTPMVGLGVLSQPEPALGVLIAAGALLLGVGGCRLVMEKERAACKTILNATLIVGALRVSMSVLMMALNRIYHVQPDESGTIQTPETYFRLLYSCISVLGLIVLNSKRRPLDGA